MFIQMSLWDTHNATFSPALESGVTHSEKPVGPMINRSGPAVAHASLTARQAREKGKLTSGTYGPRGSISSSSVALEQYLASSLQARLHSVGSTLYRLTWKERTTPAGRSIYALRASVPRTSDNASISLLKAGWITPTSRDHKGDPTTPRARGRQLPYQATLAGWPTPIASDSSKGGRVSPRSVGMALPETVALLRDPAGPVRLTASGETLTGSAAEMESSGRLNPAHSRWLMGLPPMWDDCAVMAMQSMRS